MKKDLLTPAEVGRAFGVEAKTVVRWAKAGKLPCIRTVGSHRRFRREDVEALLAQCAEPRQDMR